MVHVIYLHGFMSSPNSSKAQFLADRLRRHNIHLQCPDLNEPDFATLTISRMIAQVKSTIRSLSADSVVLMGSSLGASVALHLAEEMDCSGPSANESLVDRLILLAPALDVGQRRFGDVDEQGMKRWLASGWLELMHHAYGEIRGIRYEFYDDARRYSSSSIRQKVPTLILQGDRDTVVDPQSVANFAAQRSHVQLVRLDDDHQLMNSLTQVWTETEMFLGLRSY
jgi:pimeloyl-ACP methyl ester carboxylesterase